MDRLNGRDMSRQRSMCYPAVADATAVHFRRGFRVLLPRHPASTECSRRPVASMT
jgi:hypothetical protein